MLNYSPQLSKARKQTRWPCDWDVSNQNKRYTEEEEQIIQNCIKNDRVDLEDLVRLAKQFKRGRWAIEVKVMNMRMENQHSLKRRMYKQNFQTRRKNKQPVWKMKTDIPFAQLSIKKAAIWEQQTEVTLNKPKSAQTVRNMHTQKLHKKEIETKMCALQNRKFKPDKMIVQSTSQEIEDELKDLLGL